MTGHSPPGQLIKLGSTAAVFLMQWLLQARRAAALNKVPVQHPLPKLLETTYHAHPYTICTSVAFGFDQFLTPQLIITYPHPHHILKLLTYPDISRLPTRFLGSNPFHPSNRDTAASTSQADDSKASHAIT